MALADKMIKTLMEKLDCDEETAKEIIETDKRINKGEKLFELPKELEEGAKKARNAGNCKGYTKPTNREKKVDTEKREIINLIAETVENVTDNGTVEIANPERELTFTKDNRKYKIVLSCPRS
jgi:hypothetical protein